MAFRHTTFHSLTLIFVFLSFSAILAAAQLNCTIKLNSAMSAGANDPPWLSPSQEFAFGFRPLQSSDDQNLFLLSIWLNKIPEQTIVWSKNDHQVPERSRIELTNEGQLVLTDPQNSELWRAEIGEQRATCAAMLDLGNFVLTNGDSSTIWDSFSLPTDTLLPGQRLNMRESLSSRQSDLNYTDGRFRLRMQDDGNLVLNPIFFPTEALSDAYWSSRTIYKPNSSNFQLIFHEAGYIYIQANNRNIHNITNKDMGSRQDYYFRATLDIDGVFRHYRHPRNNYATVGGCSSSWSIIQTNPADICIAITGDVGSGACGYNSICANSDGKPNCSCPEWYSLVNPLDASGGCKPNFSFPTCQQNSWETNLQSVDFKELPNTDWPLTDYELQTGDNVDKEVCKEFCRRDCFCAVAIHTGNKCWKKKFPLSNGRYSKEVNRTALVKVPVSNVMSSCSVKKDRSTLVIVLSALLGSSVFINFVMLVFISVVIFFFYHKKLLSLQSSPVYGTRKYSYKELEEASGGFEQHLGRGSFGTVYKGYVPSFPKRYIAIKKLDKIEKQGEKEFMTEVNAIGQTHHKNLVALLGYCDEGNNRMLVYEYMRNGSLANHLFGLTRPHWNQRMHIALGISRGLTYLHEECGTQIIHCDIKPQNILLDEYLVPKISDFGMAKLLLSEQSRAARTHIRGTIGYFAPEWFRKASISSKVDVYSFGVMLLEIICCMSSVGFAMGDEEEALIDWVYECYIKKKVSKLVENDEEARNDLSSVERFVMVGIWCIQEDPSLRPSMRRVSQMLEGVAQVSVPPRPLFLQSSREVPDSIFTTSSSN